MERDKMIEKIARIICENGAVDCFCPESERVACTTYNKARDILNELIPEEAIVLTQEMAYEYREDLAKVKYLKNEIRNETASDIWKKGRQLYNEHPDKDLAMNLLAAWIENNFGV